ncbi:hypothetical protein KHA80_10860 [Anaerobacillus sp. HL2]|nr:hypothetical protein KHA80_10860 [Anaerobacillus sp. HL2]
MANNLKIGLRLAIGFVAVIIIAAIVSIVAITNIKKFRFQHQTLLESPLTVRAASLEAEINSH